MIRFLCECVCVCACVIVEQIYMFYVLLQVI